MQKELVGQWYKEDMGETINIFDEEPLRMKMSFSSSGYYNFAPNCVYEKDGYFCYEINDEHFRMVYQVRYDAETDRLVGHYTQFGKETEVVYTRVSATPADEPYYFKPTHIYVPGTDETRLEVLQRYADYDRDSAFPYEDEWVLERLTGKVPAILAKYEYEKYVTLGAEPTDETVFRLLDFVCDHFGHNGSGGMGNGRGIPDLIHFCERNDMKTNCRGLAILLASLLRYHGIKARHITCVPYEDPFDDCHVVVDCLLPSGKRIMLDPTWRLYLHDKDGEYISLPHLRELLLRGEPIFPNESAGYNGEGFDADYHRDYMTKNTMRFARCTLHKECVDGSYPDRPYITLVPKNYPVENFKDSDKEHFVTNDEEFWRM